MCVALADLDFSHITKISQIYEKMPKIVSIYKLTFEDGAEYVGQTILEVASRVAAHAHNPANYELHQRLNRGDKFKTKILTRALAEHAHVAEAREIAKLKKPINITHAKS